MAAQRSGAGGGRQHRYAGEAVQAYVFDERDDVRLWVVEQKLQSGLAQTPSDHREVEHERGIREDELGEVDDDVRGGLQRLRERPPAQRLRGAILVAAAA
jgi:hypothetical protein